MHLLHEVTREILYGHISPRSLLNSGYIRAFFPGSTIELRDMIWNPSLLAKEREKNF